MRIIRPRDPRYSKTIRPSLLWSQAVLQKSEIALLGTLVAIAGYMLIINPFALSAALISSVMAIAFGFINQAVGLPIKSWHLASVVIATATIAAGSSVDPASAQMFGNLEEAVNAAITETGGTAIDESVIATIFNIFRILIVLAFLIGVVIVFTQATRGGDWQPIANLLAIGIAFVIGVEVISVLIIGDGGGA